MNFPKITNSIIAHDWGYKWGRHTQMSNPARNLFVPWTATLYMATGEKTQKIKSKVYNVLITQRRGINSIDINITCFKFEAFTHVEIAIFLQDQNPLVKINN